MIALLLAGILGVQLQPPVRYSKMIELANPGGGKPRLQIVVPDDSLEVPKTAPKDRTLIFDWVVSGLAKKLGSDGSPQIRFRVFSQKRRSEDDPAPKVARMLLRLWDLNSQLLGIDHSEAFLMRMVDVYLCEGGRPGGEQRFDEDLNPVTNRPDKVNTIYINELSSFSDPLEMAREIAHEYGHATLPPVGIYSGPEDWANGYMGERLYLKWLRDLIKAGNLQPDDAMGATVTALDGYLAKYVDPLVKRMGLSGPNRKVLSMKGAPAMEEYWALVAYAQAIFPPKLLRRAFSLSGSQEALDFESSMVEAAEEPGSWTLKIPELLKGSRIWIPVGEATVSGGKVVQSKKGWSQVAPTGPELKISN